MSREALPLRHAGTAQTWRAIVQRCPEHIERRFGHWAEQSVSEILDTEDLSSSGESRSWSRWPWRISKPTVPVKSSGNDCRVWSRSAKSRFQPPRDAVADCLREYAADHEFDHTVLALLEEEKKFLRAYAVDHVTGLESLLTDRYRRVLTAEGTAAQAIETRSITVWSAEDLDRAGTAVTKQMRGAGIQSLCNVPLLSGDQVLGSLNLGSLRRNAFRSEDMEYLQQMANLIAAAIRNANAYREVAQLKDRLASEKRYLEGEIRTEMRWDEIVGSSPALKRSGLPRLSPPPILRS